MNKRYADLLSIPEGHALAQTSAEDFQDDSVVGSLIWLDEIDEHHDVVSTHQIFDGRSVSNPDEAVLKTID